MKARPFARVMTKEDYETFEDGLREEAELTARVEKFQELRKMGIKNKSDISGYEKDKRVYVFSSYI